MFWRIFAGGWPELSLLPLVQANFWQKKNKHVNHACYRFSVALSRHGTYFYILGTCQRTVNHTWQSCMFGNMNQTNCRIENNRHKPEHIDKHRHRYRNRRHTCTNMQIHPPHPQHLPHPHTPKLEHTCTETNKHPPPHRSIPYTSRHCVLRSWSSKNSLFGVATSVQFGSCGAGAWIGNYSKTMVESWNLPLSWLGPKGLAPAAPWGMSTPMAASTIPSSGVVISKIYTTWTEFQDFIQWSCLEAWTKVVGHHRAHPCHLQRQDSARRLKNRKKSAKTHQR